MYRKVHALFVSDPLGTPSLQRGRLMPHRIYKEKRQPDIDDAGQRQQRTEKDAEDVGRPLLSTDTIMNTTSAAVNTAASTSSTTANQRGISSTSFTRCGMRRSYP